MSGGGFDVTFPPLAQHVGSGIPALKRKRIASPIFRFVVLLSVAVVSVADVNVAVFCGWAPPPPVNRFQPYASMKLFWMVYGPDPPTMPSPTDWVVVTLSFVCVQQKPAIYEFWMVMFWPSSRIPKPALRKSFGIGLSDSSYGRITTRS